MGGTAGLIQANVGLNVVFHNTQWVIALHAHTFLLTAVGTLVFAVLYALVPMLTKLEFRYKRLVDVHLWLWLIGCVAMPYAMGMAGSQGMLRRTLYGASHVYQPYVLIAIVAGIVIAAAFAVFLFNLIATVGLKNVIGLFLPERWLTRRPQAAGV
jgi:cytochrome c oxidase subunit 1